MPVDRIQPRHNLDNIPHALRAIAADFEDGTEPMPAYLMLVLVYDPNAPVRVSQIGPEASGLEKAGAFTDAIRIVTQRENP